MINKTLILKTLKEYKKFKSDSEFARFLEISNQNLSAWYRRNTFDENKIVDKFPEINRIWILTGEEEMIKTNDVEYNELTNEKIRLLKESGARYETREFHSPQNKMNEVVISREVFQLLLSQQETLQSQQRTIESILVKRK